MGCDRRQEVGGGQEQTTYRVSSGSSLSSRKTPDGVSMDPSTGVLRSRALRPAGKQDLLSSGSRHLGVWRVDVVECMSPDDEMLPRWSCAAARPDVW